MAAFCNYWSWMTPDIFWDLDMAEYHGLSEFMKKVERERVRNEAAPAKPTTTLAAMAAQYGE